MPWFCHESWQNVYDFLNEIVIMASIYNLLFSSLKSIPFSIFQYAIHTALEREKNLLYIFLYFYCHIWCLNRPLFCLDFPVVLGMSIEINFTPGDLSVMEIFTGLVQVFQCKSVSFGEPT